MNRTRPIESLNANASLKARSEAVPFAPNPVSVLARLLEGNEYPVLFWRSTEKSVYAAAGSVGFQQDDSGSWGETLASAFRGLREEFAECEEKRLLRFFFSVFFDPEQRKGNEWKNFPSFSFLVPKFLFRQEEGAAMIIRASKNGDDELQLKWDDLSCFNDEAPSKDKFRSADFRIDWNDDGYVNALSQALPILQKKALDKIVLARQCRITAERDFDILPIVRSLIEEYPDCACYVYAPVKGQCFISATPERLARARGAEFSTTALAGTLPFEADIHPVDSGSPHILTSGKNLKEHRFVVDMLENAAREFCAEVRIGEPTTLKLKDIVHLATPVHGVFRRGKTLIDAVRSLHPTPAVCGTPREKALDSIRTLEPFSRGMYAGTAGWIDIEGNGEAIVAIRSALIKGNRADLYAGAGIIAESDIGEELEETRLKLQTILHALEKG